MLVILVFMVTFITTLVWANNVVFEEAPVHSILPALSFFAAVIMAILSFLLKWLITRDRASIDVRIDEMKKCMDDESKEMKSYIDGLGVKVERIADTVDQKVNDGLVELRRHDTELFQKWNSLNREFGQLKGAHDTLKEQYHRNFKSGCSDD